MAAKSAIERSRGEIKFRTLFEAALDAMVIVAKDGRIVLVNAQAEKLFGYSRTELIGNPVEMLIPPRFRSRHIQHRTAYASAPKIRAMGTGLDLYGHRKDCTDFPIEVGLCPLETEDGKLVSTVIRDITERKRAEETRALLASLVTTASDAIVSKSRDGLILNWNAGAERLYGYSAQQAIGRPFVMMVPPRLRAEFARMTEWLAAGGSFSEYETRRIRSDGTEIDVAVTASPILDASGRFVASSSITRDITDRKRAEREAKAHAEELAHSNAELEQFAYVASHDLQEPLRMVASYLQLIRQRYEGRLDADADDFIRFAVDGATRMKQLINDLLSYSRAGRVQNAQPVNLDAVIEHVLGALRLRIEESRAAITRDPMPRVMGEEVRLYEVFQNLVGNALKFNGDSTPAIHVGCSRKNGEWLFSVADNGIGIAPEYHERIFAMFQRLHGRGEYPGTGIGLAICKRVIERHGGRIWLESAPGKGSVFSFTLPAIDREVMREPAN
ncbi:MAG TPA: PAS domain S-box protein [Candidatus Binataceae bacterium]|nr:PAS domain S-box protein [Candidatus Binataceae bacterium]